MVWGEFPGEGPRAGQMRACRHLCPVTLRGTLGGSEQAKDRGSLYPPPFSGAASEDSHPCLGAQHWEAGLQPLQVPGCGSGVLPPRCTPTFAWNLGHLGLAQSPGPWAPDLGVLKASPRPTPRLRREKEGRACQLPHLVYLHFCLCKSEGLQLTPHLPATGTLNQACP